MIFAVVDYLGIVGPAVTLIGAIAVAAIAYVKIKPEAESIAIKTTLEVNEDLREERAEARKEAEELRRRLREREDEIASLQIKVTGMRIQLETLEDEVGALRLNAGLTG